MPVYFERRCMKFTSRGFSEEMPPSLLISSVPEERCSRFWFISSNKDAGDHPLKWRLRGRGSRRKISSLFSCRRGLYQTPRRESQAPRGGVFNKSEETFCN